MQRKDSMYVKGSSWNQNSYFYWCIDVYYLLVVGKVRSEVWDMWKVNWENQEREREREIIRCNEGEMCKCAHDTSLGNRKIRLWRSSLFQQTIKVKKWKTVSEKCSDILFSVCVCYRNIHQQCAVLHFPGHKNKSCGSFAQGKPSTDQQGDAFTTQIDRALTSTVWFPYSHTPDFPVPKTCLINQPDFSP